DEFRHSFYLAQAELGIVRRSDDDGDGRKVIEDMVGIGTLARAATSARKDLEKARDASDTLSRQAGVARAVADAQRVEPGFGEVRSCVDRLIDYQAKMAELDARLDLYKLEVKRSLDAPTIEAEDIEELEGLALPSTPAAGLKLSEARVVRLRRARSKAIVRAIIFGTFMV